MEEVTDSANDSSHKVNKIIEILQKCQDQRKALYDVINTTIDELEKIKSVKNLGDQRLMIAQCLNRNYHLLSEAKGATRFLPGAKAREQSMDANYKPEHETIHSALNAIRIVLEQEFGTDAKKLNARNGTTDALSAMIKNATHKASISYRAVQTSFSTLKAVQPVKETLPGPIGVYESSDSKLQFWALLLASSYGMSQHRPQSGNSAVLATNILAHRLDATPGEYFKTDKSVQDQGQYLDSMVVYEVTIKDPHGIPQKTGIIGYSEAQAKAIVEVALNNPDFHKDILNRVSNKLDPTVEEPQKDKDVDSGLKF